MGIGKQATRITEARREQRFIKTFLQDVQRPTAHEPLAAGCDQNLRRTAAVGRLVVTANEKRDFLSDLRDQTSIRNRSALQVASQVLQYPGSLNTEFALRLPVFSSKCRTTKQAQTDPTPTLARRKVKFSFVIRHSRFVATPSCSVLNQFIFAL